MKRMIGAAFVCVALAAVPGTAAAATDGQIVTVERSGAGEALVTYNPPGLDGRRTLYTGGDLSDPQWSPDGNRIVFGEGGAVKLYDATTGQVSDFTNGTLPTWTEDGAGVTFVRGDQVITRTTAGAETVLPDVSGAGVRDLTWGPGGEVLVLWVGNRIDMWIGELQGQFPAIADVAGGLEVDGDDAVFPRTVGTTTSLFRPAAEEDGPDVRLTNEPGAADTDPDASPTRRIIFTRSRGGQTQLGLLHNGELTVFGNGQTEPDWQPCVAGVTNECRSVSPTLPSRRAPECHSTVPAGQAHTVVTDGQARPAFACSAVARLELVDAPAHGTVTFAGTRRGAVVYRSAAGYTGPDTFSFRGVSSDGRTSAPVSVTINVRAKAVRPAAPKLTLAAGALKLDRRGRVTVRGTCDRACVVSLRVRVKLNSGRVLSGRLVKAQAAAGGKVTLRLRRKALPPKRKVAWARVSGQVTGTDGRTRTVIVKLR